MFECQTLVFAWVWLKKSRKGHGWQMREETLLLSVSNTLEIPSPMWADGVWVSPLSIDRVKVRDWERERKKWDNGPQLIHCTLKNSLLLKKETKIRLLRTEKQYSASGEDLYANRVLFIEYDSDALFSNYDLLSLMMWKCVWAHPPSGHPELHMTLTKLSNCESAFRRVVNKCAP